MICLLPVAVNLWQINQIGEKSSSVFSDEKMISLIMANDRQPVISYSCLIVTIAPSVFIIETWYKVTDLHTTEIKAKLETLKTRN